MKTPPAPAPEDVVASLADRLVAGCAVCSSKEEANGVAEAVLEDFSIVLENRAPTATDGGAQVESYIPICAAALSEYYDLGEGEAISVVRDALGEHFEIDELAGSDGAKSEEDNSLLESDCVNGSGLDFEGGSEEEDRYVGEGECELCERTVKLTRHHLIPKSTWSKMKRRLANAADAVAEGDAREANRLLGGEFTDLPPEMTSKSVTRFLSKTCDICRPCHTQVHKLHDHMVLAERYNTVERLLTDSAVLKFCKWNSKQKPGKYAIVTR